MSSPFQQKFSVKNPFGKNKQKNPKLNSVDTESYLPEAQFAGDDIGSYDPEGAVVSERLEENYPASVDNKKKTQVDSPLDYAYVSTAPHFQRLQDNIAAAFTPRGGKTKADKEAEFKGETKKVSKKLKETTDKGFKDYNAKAEFNSKSGSFFDKDESNYFNKYGQ